MWRRKHRHSWTHMEVWNGITLGARIATCSCGEERFELTGAGWQQVGWWMQDGLTVEEATARVRAGDYPWHIFHAASS